MSEREELFDIARSVIDGELGILVNGSDIDNTADSLSYALLAAGYYKPRTITTPWDLDALPSGVLILTEQGGCWESIKRMDGLNWWKEPGGTGVSPSADLALPATVLYEPEPKP